MSQRLTLRCLPPVTGGVCLATRVRYRQSCGLDTWSALLAYLFVSRICVAGLCLCFFCSPLRSDRGRFSRLLFFFLSFSSFVCIVLDVAMVWKGKPASVTTGSRDRTYVRKIINNNNIRTIYPYTVTTCFQDWSASTFGGDGDQETVQITSNGWRPGITLANFFGEKAGGRRSLVMRGLSVILTLQPKFLDRFRSYVDL